MAKGQESDICLTTYLLGARVSFTVDLQQMARLEVSVPLRRRQTCVAEKLLDRTEIRATLQEVGGEAVAHRVWTDLPRQRDGSYPLGHQAPHGSIGQSTTTDVHEYGIRRGPRGCPEGKIGLQGLGGTLAVGNDPLFSAFTQHPDHP